MEIGLSTWGVVHMNIIGNTVYGGADWDFMSVFMEIYQAKCLKNGRLNLKSSVNRMDHRHALAEKILHTTSMLRGVRVVISRP